MNNNLIDFFERDKFAAYVGIKLVEVRPGYAVAKLEISNKHLNPENIVQGGVTFTLADFTFAAAANSYGQVSLSINASISYFQPPKGKFLMAVAKEVSTSNKLTSYNVDIFDENEDLIARFMGTAYRKNEKVDF